MPGAKSAHIPSYRLHKPSGLAVVRLNGRDIYLGPHGTPESQADYKRVITEWLANQRQAPRKAGTGTDETDRSDLTVNELFLTFWNLATEYYVKDGQPTGELANIRDAARPLTALYGQTDVAAFGPRALETVRQAMIDQGLSRKVINGRINRIRRMFKWGVSKQMVPPLVLQSLQALASLKKGRCNVREAAPVKPVPDDRVEAVLDHVSPQVAAMIELQRLTGMRPGEVVILRHCEVDTSGRPWVYTPASHKTEHHEKGRVIYLGPRAQKVLKPWLKMEPEACLFSPAKAEEHRRKRQHAQRRTPLSCGNRPGTNRRKHRRKSPAERYTATSYARAIDEACDRAFPPPQKLARRRVPAAGRKAKSTRLETDVEWRRRLGEEQWAELQRWRREHRWSC